MRFPDADRADFKRRGTGMKTVVRCGACLAVAVTFVLSVVPGSLRPHVLGNEYYEHFAAYVITGGLLAIVLSGRRRLLWSGGLLILGAGLLEIVQLWIPGRTANPLDFVASAFGVATAFTVAWTAIWVKARTRPAARRNNAPAPIAPASLPGGNASAGTAGS